MSLLDATYRTTRYALPLFFLCVRTNVYYEVVAAFVTQNEDASSIAEALEVIQQWNPDWSPRLFMVDFDTAEITALKEVFPVSNSSVLSSSERIFLSSLLVGHTIQLIT